MNLPTFQRYISDLLERDIPGKLLCLLNPMLIPITSFIFQAKLKQIIDNEKCNRGTLGGKVIALQYWLQYEKSLCR